MKKLIELLSRWLWTGPTKGLASARDDLVLSVAASQACSNYEDGVLLGAVLVHRRAANRLHCQAGASRQAVGRVIKRPVGRLQWFVIGMCCSIAGLLAILSPHWPVRVAALVVSVWLRFMAIGSDQ